MIELDLAAGRLALHTAHSSYLMQVDGQGRLLHRHYGPRCGTLPPLDPPAGDPGAWPNLLPLEWPAPGLGDLRAPFFVPEYADGTEAADFRFVSAQALPGKYSLPDLPAFWAEGEAGETLLVTLRDAAGLELQLLYGVLADCDVLTRAAVVVNTGLSPVRLHGVPSLSLDFPRQDLELITFDGAWAAERTPCRAPLRPGVQSVGSIGGIPTHAHNPFAVLCDPAATETEGDCWGFALVYSGSFLLQAERSAAGVRFSAGIQPYHFHWTLAPGQRFTTPECALTYSGEGLGGMSAHLHKAIRSHLLRGKWRDMAHPRPVLLNSWEAAYFDFDEARLLELAAAAKAADIDLFVLDDGWFRGRNDDTSSLGDWSPDARKLPGGLAGLCRKLNALGLDFGLWVEPENVSPNSDLYRAHPDWALQIPGRETLAIRSQYTLDVSRPEVRENICGQLFDLLDSCPIRYIKWDMNRSLSNVYSAALPASRQGEVYHRYVLGMYAMQEALLRRYPDLLLENCSSGGARFDCGMLYYSPQIWCSDNTDALSRLTIQYGSSFCYPPCVMGAHFSTVPNHVNGHVSSVEARMALALSGTFGYELDLTRYTPGELAALRPYAAFYRAHGPLLRSGRLFRLRPPEDGGAAWAIAAEDGSELVAFAAGPALDGGRLPLPFADRAAWYQAEDGTRYTGLELAERGLPLPRFLPGPLAPDPLPGYFCYLGRTGGEADKA